MRVKEIPKLLFEQILAESGLEPHTINLGGGRKIEAIFLENVRGAISYGEDSYHGGIFTNLTVWKIFFKPHFTPRDFSKEINKAKDILTVVGGPFSDGFWSLSQGYSLIETVKISTRHRDFKIDDPTVVLMYTVLSMALNLAYENPPVNLQYWEAFKNPNINRTKPP